MFSIVLKKVLLIRMKWTEKKFSFNLQTNPIMKNFLFLTAILCLLASCSNDSDFDPLLIENSDETVPNLKMNPENQRNYFDFKGKAYYDVLVDYQSNNQFPNSIDQMSLQIRYLKSHIEKKNTQKSKIIFNDSIVESIMADPDNCMINIVQNSQLTSTAKGTLINFLQGLINHRQLDFTTSYNYIVGYEETIIDSSSFDEDESETILTITSISRYSLYSEAERKDKDWDLSAGNKPARKFFSTNDASIISIIALLQNLI
ncbi:hypothetical protein B0A67_00210 [Flavobacterium aquidurense]|nr:hypothetical protein B0A67_00210 [Flavobacterium aquidurense]SHF90436.1 hypothetical protein SAMN05444481_10143 [Flavobacterium frigidimaris]